MVRALNILFILAVVIGAATVYDMKLAATKSAEKVAQLQRQIDDERDVIRHLKAEWSLLNKPERLQTLVERYNDYLQLESLDVKQIVTPEDLPARPVMLEPIGGANKMGGYAGSSVVIR
ncbi:putative secreted (periplasmic) protein [Roseibium album]|jgi:cell division protein FtsL|nr:putative secreted (periplasmic) protein [Roseibium album]